MPSSYVVQEEEKITCLTQQFVAFSRNLSLTCVVFTSDLSMPSEVALEKSASATLMAIEIRFEVLNGSSSYLTRRNNVFERKTEKNANKGRKKKTN